ncbi:MAG TPA: class I SAM-dependent methyltransferase [Ktedonobacteraceae bacterium]|nr:class I SAM-dependent methyltransferase [Ktedonobacteraceae bacterium]
MEDKPAQFDRSYAEAFKDRQVVSAYRHRPPYPAEVFTILDELITEEPRAVLDVGAGSGDLARQLVERVERIDAVDPSAQMIARGQQLPAGQHPHLHWIHGAVEEVPLAPPYALIMAGSSIHWTDWPRAFPRFRQLLTPAGVLALVHRNTLLMPWSIEFSELRAQYSARVGQGSANAVVELERRGWFRRQGEKKSAPVLFMQTIDDFIVGLHSRSHLARERLGEQRAAEFDEQVRRLLLSYHSDGWLPLQVVGTVTWGQPAVDISA